MQASSTFATFEENATSKTDDTAQSVQNRENIPTVIQDLKIPQELNIQRAGGSDDGKYVCMYPGRKL